MKKRIVGAVSAALLSAVAVLGVASAATAAPANQADAGVSVSAGGNWFASPLGLELDND